MRIFADENVPGGAVLWLRSAGHDVVWGVEIDAGATDIARLSTAHAEGRIVLTEDQDFADMVIRDGLPILGLIKFSLDGLKRQAKIDRLIAGLADVVETATGKLVVIEPARIRIRDLT